MNSGPPCPSREQLERMLVGAIPVPEVEDLQGHVSGCSRCLEVMREVTTEDAFILALRTSGKAETITSENTDATLLERLRQLFASAKSTGTVSVQTLPAEMNRAEELSGLLAPPPGRSGVLQGVLTEADDPDPEVRLDVARALERAANIQTLLGRGRDGMANYRRAIDLIENLPDTQRDLPPTQRLLAACYGCLGLEIPDDLAEAQRHLDKALTIAERLAQTSPDDPLLQEDVARIAHQLAQRYMALNRWADAEPLCIRAVNLRTGLVRDHPKERSYLEALAEDYISLGLVYAATGRWSKGSASYAKVEELLRPLIAQEPKDVRASHALVATYINWGLGLIEIGQLQTALDRANQAVELNEAVRRREPAFETARRHGHNAHCLRARIYERLGRWADAVKDLDEAVALAEALADKQNLLINRLGRALNRARAGNHRAATVEARSLAEAPGAEVGVRYNVACIYAQAIRSAVADKALSATEQIATAERYAAQAVALLNRLKDAGYFQSVERLEMLKTDPDLQPLRERSDFRKLLAKE